jgi:hypothetical protein
MDVVPTMAMQGLQFSHKLNSQQYSINNIQPWEQLHSQTQHNLHKTVG